MVWVMLLDIGRFIICKLYLYVGGEWGGWGSIVKCCMYYGKILKWERVIKFLLMSLKRNLMLVVD